MPFAEYLVGATSGRDQRSLLQEEIRALQGFPPTRDNLTCRVDSPQDFTKTLIKTKVYDNIPTKIIRILAWKAYQ